VAAVAPPPEPTLPSRPTPSPAPSDADRRSRLINYAGLALLSLIWGTTWAAIRIGLRTIPPFTGVALRFAIAAAALLLIGRALGVPLRGGARGSPWRVWVSNGLLTFFLPYGVLYWAEQWVPSGLAAVLFATTPLWVALTAHLALPAERLRRATAVGVLVGFAGIAVIFSGDLRALGGAQVAGAAALLLVAPLTSAIGVVIVKRWAAGMHPLSIVAIPMALTGVAMGAAGWALERGAPLQLTGLPLAALLYLALCGSAFSFTVYFWLLARLPATTLSLINYLTPLVALAIGALLGETLNARTLAGSALVVGGVAVAMGVRKR
jgi:drug/metabolite transporter (DMT)-like permease